MSARCDRVLYHRPVTSAHDSYTAAVMYWSVFPTATRRPSVRTRTMSLSSGHAAARGPVSGAALCPARVA